MKKIKLCKGGEQMKTLIRNKNLKRHVDGELTQDQLDQLIPILDEIRYRREMGIAKYYTEEEVHQELLQIIEEAKRRNGQL